MAESSSYFEAHRHVLQALQRTDGQSIPFGKTLLNCTQTVDPPSYLLPPDGSHMDARGDYDRYDFAHVLPQIHSSDSHGPSHLRVLKPWPKWQPPPPGDSSGAGAGASGPAKPSSDNSDTGTSTMDYHLDEPQMEALKHALTKEVAIIQGVPATGTCCSQAQAAASVRGGQRGCAPP